MSKGAKPTSKISWEEEIAALDKLVVVGRHDECRNILAKFAPRNIPREWAVAFAVLANRTQLHVTALKALHRFIFPENRFSQPATDVEKIHYSTALYMLGSTNEALSILSAVDVNLNPEALLHMSIAHFCEWNYEAAVPLLKKFVQDKSISHYRRAVGSVNLMSAFMATENWLEAFKLSEEVLRDCEANGYKLLAANVKELLAQYHFFHGRFEDSVVNAEGAREMLGVQEGFYTLFADKWKSVAEFFLYRSEEKLNNLRAIGLRARTNGHWHTVRECDLFEAVAAQDTNLIRKVIFGSPFENYRRRARKLFGAHIVAKGNFLLRVGPAEDANEIRVFDPMTRVKPDGDPLHKTPLLFHLFEAITEDFYQPSSMGALFQKVHPQETFNPYTSPQRLLQLLRRLDGWFKENDLPLRVHFKRSEFRLVSNVALDLKIRRVVKLSAEQARLEEFRSHFKNRSFSNDDVSTTLNISKSSALRLIRKALDGGQLTKEKSRTGRPYAFRNNRRRVAA